MFRAPLSLVSLTLAAQSGLAQDPALKAVIDLSDTDLPQALARAHEEVRKRPTFSEAWRVRGLVRRKQKDYPGALKDYSEAMRLDPRNLLAVVGRGNTYLEAKDLPAALKDAKTAQAMDPSYPRVWSLEGEVLLEQGKAAQALPLMDRAVALGAKEAVHWSNRARVRARMEDLGGALKDYSTALEVDPRHHFATYNRALLLEKQRDFSGASRDYEAAIAGGYRVADACTRLGGIRKAQGRTAEAARLAQQAVQLNPTHREALALQASLGGAASPLPVTSVSPAAPGAPPVPAALLEPLSINRMTGQRYNAMVGAAMEAMRLVTGPRTPEEVKAFEAKWTPLFDFPTPEGIEYFQKLNPLLVEWLTLRERIFHATEAFDATWGEAVLSAGFGSEEGVHEGMALAAQCRTELLNLQARFKVVTEAILRLGDPPNALEGRRKRRAAHEAAVKELRALVTKPAPAAPAATSNTYTLAEVKVEPTGSGSSDATASGSSGAFTCKWKGRDQTKKEYTATYAASWPEPPKVLTGGQKLRMSAQLNVSWEPNAYGRFSFMNLPKVTLGDSDALRGEVFLHPQYPDRTTARMAPEWEVPAGRPTYEVFALAWVGSNEKDAWMDFPGRFGAVKVRYLYRAGNAPAPASPAGPSPSEEGLRRAQEAALLETIAFHQENIRQLEKNLARDQAELSSLKNALDDRAQALAFRILTGKAEIQAEQDLIASYQTGQLVHTRTAWDDHVQATFLASIHANQQRADAMLHGAAELQRLGALLPPGEAESMRAFLNRQLTPAVMAKGDLETLQRAREAVVNKVEGYRQQAVAQGELAQAERALFWLGAAQRAGTTAAYILGGQSFATAYAGVTGTISGGPLEGIRDAAAWYSQPTYLAVEALDGYQKGAYLGGPGVTGAVEKVAVAAGLNKLFEWGVGYMGRGAQSLNNRANLGRQRPVVSGSEFSAKDVARMRQEMAQGERLAKDLQRLDDQLGKAVSQGKPAVEVQALRKQVMDKAADLQGNFYAKLYVKNAKGSLEKTALKWGNQIKGDVDREFRALLRREGWDVDRLPLKDMRNARSRGSFGMDRDYGVSAADLKPDSLLKGGKAASVSLLQKDGSRLYEQAYRNVTGKSAERALHTFTTPMHKESFRDLGVLNDLTRPGQVAKLDKVWGEQTGWTILLKGKEMLDPKHLQSIGMSKVAGYMEAGRGLAKELETKIIPFLSQTPGTRPEAIRSLTNHYKGLLGVLERFRKADTGFDPIEASRAIRAYTGGKDLHQVLEDVRFVTETLHKFR